VSIAEAISEIERMDFSARLGLANSFQVFLRNISNDPSVKAVLDSTKSPENSQRVLQRVLSLASLKTDFRYLNRYDVPLATYLWVLSRASPALAAVAAEACSNLPRTWWTEQVVRYILDDVSKRTSTPTDVQKQYSSEKLPTIVTSSLSTSTAQFLSGPVGTSEQRDEFVNLNASKTSTTVVNVVGPGEDSELSFDVTNEDSKR